MAHAMVVYGNCMQPHHGVLGAGAVIASLHDALPQHPSIMTLDQCNNPSSYHSVACVVPLANQALVQPRSKVTPTYLQGHSVP